MINCLRETSFVLLHGFPQGRRAWRALQDSLESQGYHVIVPSLPGYSEGERISNRLNYRFSVIARDLAKDLHEICGDYIIIGHDLGAAIGILLSSLSVRCKGLVTVSLPHTAAFVVSCFISTQALRSWYFLPAQSFLFSNMLFDPRRRRSRQRLSKMLLMNGMSDSQVDEVMFSVFDKFGLRGPLRWYQAMPFEGPKRIWAPVKVPWLQIHGELDSLCTEVSFNLSGRWAQSDFSSVKIPEMTHWLDESSSNAIAKAVLEFFDLR